MLAALNLAGWMITIELTVYIRKGKQGMSLKSITFIRIICSLLHAINMTDCYCVYSHTNQHVCTPNVHTFTTLCIAMQKIHCLNLTFKLFYSTMYTYQKCRAKQITGKASKFHYFHWPACGTNVMDTKSCTMCILKCWIWLSLDNIAR